MADTYTITVTRTEAPDVVTELYAQMTDDPNVVRRVVAAVNVRQRRRGKKDEEK